jgi:hypothetical protein
VSFSSCSESAEGDAVISKFSFGILTQLGQLATAGSVAGTRGTV